jgi:hypothetical protein
VTCLYLVKNGVPFDVAFSLPPDEAAAWSVIFGRMDGGTWDDERNCWRTDK